MLKCFTFFVADAALNLHTGYVDGGGTLILRRGRIMRHYAAGWLLPDVLGALGPSALAAVPGDDAYPDSFDRSELGLQDVPRFEQYRGFWFASFNSDIIDI